MSDQTMPPATPQPTPMADGTPAAASSAAQPAASPPAPAAPEAGQKPTVEQMREALKDVYDPEIPINIVDLGLVYKVEERDGVVDVEMTLTTPHCPLGYMFQQQVEDKIKALPGITKVNVKLVFEPLWTRDRMTPDGKLQASMLGFM